MEDLSVEIETGQTIHKGINCNICHSIPIIGTRYKCSSCPNFNTCISCQLQIELEPGTLHPKAHNFIVIYNSTVLSNESIQLSDKSNWIHNKVSCQDCGMNPIIGFRYVTPSDGYSLCESCEQKSTITKYSTGSKIKMVPTHISNMITQSVTEMPSISSSSLDSDYLGEPELHNEAITELGLVEEVESNTTHLITSVRSRNNSNTFESHLQNKPMPPLIPSPALLASQFQVRSMGISSLGSGGGSNSGSGNNVTSVTLSPENVSSTWNTHPFSTFWNTNSTDNSSMDNKQSISRTTPPSLCFDDIFSNVIQSGFNNPTTVDKQPLLLTQGTDDCTTPGDNLYDSITERCLNSLLDTTPRTSGRKSTTDGTESTPTPVVTNNTSMHSMSTGSFLTPLASVHSSTPIVSSSSDSSLYPASSVYTGSSNDSHSGRDDTKSRKNVTDNNLTTTLEKSKQSQSQQQEQPLLEGFDREFPSLQDAHQKCLFPPDTPPPAAKKNWASVAGSGTRAHFTKFDLRPAKGSSTTANKENQDTTSEGSISTDDEHKHTHSQSKQITGHESAEKGAGMENKGGLANQHQNNAWQNSNSANKQIKWQMEGGGMRQIKWQVTDNSQKMSFKFGSTAKSSPFRNTSTATSTSAAVSHYSHSSDESGQQHNQTPRQYSVEGDNRGQRKQSPNNLHSNLNTVPTHAVGAFPSPSQQQQQHQQQTAQINYLVPVMPVIDLNSTNAAKAFEFYNQLQSMQQQMQQQQQALYNSQIMQSVGVGVGMQMPTMSMHMAGGCYNVCQYYGSPSPAPNLTHGVGYSNNIQPQMTTAYPSQSQMPVYNNATGAYYNYCQNPADPQYIRNFSQSSLASSVSQPLPPPPLPSTRYPTTMHTTTNNGNKSMNRSKVGTSVSSNDSCNSGANGGKSNKM